MFGPLGMQELIFIFVIALIVFGPRKLPGLGKSVGKSIAEFKKASNELRSTLEREVNLEETRKEILEPIQSVARDAERVVRDQVDRAMDEADADSESRDAVETASVSAVTEPEPGPGPGPGDDDEDAKKEVSQPIASTAIEPE